MFLYSGNLPVSLFTKCARISYTYALSHFWHKSYINKKTLALPYVCINWSESKYRNMEILAYIMLIWHLLYIIYHAKYIISICSCTCIDRSCTEWRFTCSNITMRLITCFCRVDICISSFTNNVHTQWCIFEKNSSVLYALDVILKSKTAINKITVVGLNSSDLDKTRIFFLKIF